MNLRDVSPESATAGSAAPGARLSLPVLSLLLAATLAACGGGGDAPVADAASPGVAGGVASAGSGAASAVGNAASGAVPVVPPPVVTTTTPAANSDLVTAVTAPTYAAGTSARGAWTLLMNNRSACGFGLLQQDTRLDTAAAAHAGYMTTNSVAGNTLVAGHDESATATGFYAASPSARAAKAGYPNQVAEILTEQATYYPTTSNSSLVAGEALGAASMLQLLETVYHLSTAMYPGRNGGVGLSLQTAAYSTPGFNQTVSALVADIGADTPAQKLGTGVVATWPCSGVSGVTGRFAPAFESPLPFSDVTSTSTVYGTPVYFRADPGTALTVTSATIVRQGTATALATRQLTRANDPNKLLGTNEAFVVPTSKLQAGATYTVTASGTVGGTAFTRQFSFSTAP